MLSDVMLCLFCCEPSRCYETMNVMTVVTVVTVVTVMTVVTVVHAGYVVSVVHAGYVVTVRVCCDSLHGSSLSTLNCK